MGGRRTLDDAGLVSCHIVPQELQSVDWSVYDVHSRSTEICML